MGLLIKEKLVRILGENLFIITLSILIILLHVLMHGNFRKESIDDPWMLSWIYNYFKTGIRYDFSFRGDAPGSALQLFFMTYVYIYGFTLNLIGFTQNNAHLISKLFLFGSVGLWYAIITKLNYKREIAIITVLLMLLLEPYLFIGNLARADALTFFLATLSLFLFMKDFYLLSGITTLVAFETHPMGIMAFFYIAAYVIYKREDIFAEKSLLLKRFGLFFIGCMIGCAYYLFLHFEYIIYLFYTVEESLGKNCLYSYFFEERYYRHLPELMIIIAALFVYLKKKIYKEDQFSLIFLIVALISAFLIRREISLYIIYIYPALLLIITLSFDNINRLKIITIIYIALLLPQYAYVYKQFSSYDLNAFIDKVTLSVPDDGLPVVGNPNSWYAFKDRDFREYSNVPTEYFDINSGFYIVENTSYIEWYNYQDIWVYINKEYPNKIIDSFIINGEAINIRYYEGQSK